MSLIETVSEVIESLERASASYLVSGSLAAIHYSLVRTTRDADFVVDLQPSGVKEILKHLGPRFIFDPQLTFEAITGTLRYIIDIPDVPFRIELFLLSRDEHDQERFRRRQLKFLPQFAREVPLPTVEDVIITKLRWARDAARGKDEEDLINVLAVQANQTLDWDYIHHWCEQHGTRQLLDRIRSLIPPDL